MFCVAYVYYIHMIASLDADEVIYLINTPSENLILVNILMNK
jgi:hypothetical protein